MISSVVADHKLTYEDYCAIPDDGQRHEILDGVHFVSPSPADRHQKTLVTFTYLLQSFLRRTRLGELRVAPSDVRLGEHDIVQPDLYVVLAPNLKGFWKGGFQGAPDLVIEILSPSNTAYDLVRKLPRYEHAGVVEYWAVDTDLERIEVHRREVGPGGSRFARPTLLQAARGDSLETPLLPGFTATLQEVFDPGLTPVEP